jgi:hypothetical protein
VWYVLCSEAQWERSTILSNSIIDEIRSNVMKWPHVVHGVHPRHIMHMRDDKIIILIKV